MWHRIKNKTRKKGRKEPYFSHHGIRDIFMPCTLLATGDILLTR
jgi:hypothetical protein